MTPLRFYDVHVITIEEEVDHTMTARLVRFDPFREMAALQNDVTRLMGVLREGNGATERPWIPALDVWETENAYVYAFDLPGIPENEISVEFEDGTLTVSAERQRVEHAESDRFYRFERRFGTFTRTFELPQGVKDTDISATHNDGVLEIRVAKPEEPAPQRIKIGVGGQSDVIEGSATRSEA
jgi:HSP20 family protein